VTGRVEIQVANDNSGVGIQFVGPSGEQGVLKLTPANLLSLMQHLGETHSMVFEGGPPEVPGHHIDHSHDAKWYAEPHMVGEASILSFHHPEFGPTEFALPLDQLSHLTELLTQQILSIEKGDEHGVPLLAAPR
jgi:hypothetical protein